VGAERAKNLVSGSGAVSGCEKKLAGVGGRGAGNGAGNGSHRNRFEQQVEIVLLKILPLHSHAVLVIHFYM